jgi:hypothetical protein
LRAFAWFLLIMLACCTCRQVSGGPVMLVVTGTIHAGVEPECWLIRDDLSSKEYLLLDPPSALQVEGLRVQITGYVRTDVASYCMQGEGMLQIVSYVVVGTESTVQVTTASVSCTLTYTITLTSGEPPPPLAVPLPGSCYSFVKVPSDPILRALMNVWNWLRSLACRFGYCT